MQQEQPNPASHSQERFSGYMVHRLLSKIVWLRKHKVLFPHFVIQFYKIFSSHTSVAMLLCILHAGIALNENIKKLQVLVQGNRARKKRVHNFLYFKNQ